MVTNNSGNLGTADASKALLGNGIGNSLVFSSSKYPSSAGAVGNVLYSNGTDWVSQKPPSSTGYVMSVWAAPANPVDSANYVLITGQVLTTTQTLSAGQRFVCPKAGVLSIAYGTIRCQTTGSVEPITISAVINDTTTVNITTSASAFLNDFPFNNTSLAQAVSVGDWITFRVTCPAWISNPQQMSVSISIIII